MKQKRIYKIPVTIDQWPCEIIGVENAMETARENALWAYNNMREHDGQSPLKSFPKGTVVIDSGILPPKTIHLST
jgi:hypothetical protein